MSKPIVANIAWLFFDKVIRIFGGLFIGIWEARYLGPENFGILSYAIAYTFLFTFLVKLGLDQIVVRDIKKNPYKADLIIGTAFYLKLIGSALALCSVVLSLIIIEPGSLMTRMLILIIAISFIFQSLDVVDFSFQSQVKSKYVVLARNSAFLIAALLKVYAIMNAYSVYWFAGIFSLELFFSACLLCFFYTRVDGQIKCWRLDREIAIGLLKSSWPIMVSVFLVAVYMKVDQVMIGYYLENKDVGLYSVAVSLSEAWYFIPAIIVSTLLPYFVSLREDDHNLYLSHLSILYSLMFWMGVAAGIVVMVYGQDLIIFLYGEAYKDSYTALVYNIWAGIFVSQGIARGIWMVSEDLQLYRMYTNIFGIIINIFGNIWLIPLLGIPGAALATLLTQGISTWGISLMWNPLRQSTVFMIKAINPMCLIRFAREYIRGRE